MFTQFVSGRCDSVIRAAFVQQIQPVDHELLSAVVYAQPKPDGRVRTQQLMSWEPLKIISGRARTMIDSFMSDKESAFVEEHNLQHEENICGLPQEQDRSNAQRYHTLSDFIHLLKRIGCRRLRESPMAVAMAKCVQRQRPD
jgi:hypothetical protein